MVVASMKYPPHRTHMRWGLSSVIFILVVRCMLRGRNDNPARIVKNKKTKTKTSQNNACTKGEEPSDSCGFQTIWTKAAVYLAALKQHQELESPHRGAVKNQKSITSTDGALSSILSQLRSARNRALRVQPQTAVIAKLSRQKMKEKEPQWLIMLQIFCKSCY